MFWSTLQKFFRNANRARRTPIRNSRFGKLLVEALEDRAVPALVAPTFVDGNPDCEELVQLGLLNEEDGHQEHFKIDPVGDNLGQTYIFNVPDVGTITITITQLKDSESVEFSWTSTFGIDAVFVKGGSGGNLYNYQTLADEPLSDTFLITPTNENNDKPFGISHISFCYDLGDEPPPSDFIISGYKFYDADADGVFNTETETGIAGWKIQLDLDRDGTIDYTTFTDASGHYGFNLIPDGDYWVIEDLNSYPELGTWQATTPTSQEVSVIEGIQSPPGDVNFGNVLLGAGGGHTLGFWSNKNGEKTMNDGGSLQPELAMLNALNLVDANGNPAGGANGTLDSHKELNSFLLSAKATNMANMLSAQLAAMALNVEAGFVNGSALVYVGGDIGFTSIANLITLANNSLGANSNTTAAGAARNYQELLKNALDAANNNLNFVQLWNDDGDGIPEAGEFSNP